MKKILVLSGKGGTGKTTVASALIEFSGAGAFADCDVDAPNLHLIQNFHTMPDKREFIGSEKAHIDYEKCVSCGICMDKCRFGAIKIVDGIYRTDQFACEGCGVCAFVCPEDAVKLNDDISGETLLFKDEKVFSTAKLKMGRGNSGKLVSEVKKNLFSNVDLKREKIAVIDGSPGIGCPVIASSSGVDIALIVAEPSLSGISDMKRIVRVLKGFGVKTLVCVNKFDLSLDKTEKIRRFCMDEKLIYLGEIPYDSEVPEAINSGKSIASVDSKARDAIFEIYKKLIEIAEVDI